MQCDIDGTRSPGDLTNVCRVMMASHPNPDLQRVDGLNTLARLETLNLTLDADGLWTTTQHVLDIDHYCKTTFPHHPTFSGSGRMAQITSSANRLSLQTTQVFSEQNDLLIAVMEVHTESL
jgi:hypothetical protein